MGRGPGGPPGGSGGGSGPTPGNRHFGGFWAPTEYQILWKRGVLGVPQGGYSRGVYPVPARKSRKNRNSILSRLGELLNTLENVHPPGPGGPPGGPPRPRLPPGGAPQTPLVYPQGFCLPLPPGRVCFGSANPWAAGTAGKPRRVLTDTDASCDG